MIELLSMLPLLGAGFIVGLRIQKVVEFFEDYF